MALKLTNLTKEFDDIVAVDNVSLEADDDDFLVLVGPSGSGKTTTLRMIAGLESPTSGDVRIDGETVTEESPGDRNIAMVFQNYALYPHMTVEENLGLALKVDGIDASELETRVESVATTLGIDDLLIENPRS
jgi:multiple sugar transport system ATP-binding protein